MVVVMVTTMVARNNDALFDNSDMLAVMPVSVVEDIAVAGPAEAVGFPVPNPSHRESNVQWVVSVCVVDAKVVVLLWCGLSVQAFVERSDDVFVWCRL